MDPDRNDTESTRFPRVVKAILEASWAIRPSALGVILDIVQFRAGGGVLTDEEIMARLPDRREAPYARQGDAAVIPLYGPIFPRANLFTQISGGTSLEMFAAALQEADTDDTVKMIVLDIASPGGVVDLVPETAATIRDLDTATVAVANTEAGSAAYWLAAQADQVVVSPSGEVGSIGVWAAHEDISQQQALQGVQTTLVSAGKYKVEGHPFAPLDDEARAELQRKVDHYYGLFVEDVARGRGAAVSSVRDGFGEGRMVTAPEAVKLGMADRVATLSEVISAGRLGNVAVAASAKMPSLFDNPQFGVPGDDPRLRFDPGTGRWSCPLTVEDDRVFGHVAPLGVCLRGRPDTCVTPPEGDLEGFMRHYAPAAGGRRTGVIVLGGSHADIGVGVVEASRFYDQTGRAAADVRVGRDAFGIWFAGMLRPGISKNDRYALAASDVSGHWELDGRGRPTLVGLPAVNVGGFPKGYLTASEVAQGLAASAGVVSDCADERMERLERVVGSILAE